ncbi:hypothetical protein C5167_024849 [Papaver somniferum]|uniref:Uncharacterized protein n=1 Tax=Papaver somniferum TaxID=3469 RepID=A0A4Y7JPT2_PAPSO|nr:hypothetical protein C5167_024849 [Papaver somniferum]
MEDGFYTFKTNKYNDFSSQKCPSSSLWKFIGFWIKRELEGDMKLGFDVIGNGAAAICSTFEGNDRFNFVLDKISTTSLQNFCEHLLIRSEDSQASVLRTKYPSFDVDDLSFY